MLPRHSKPWILGAALIAGAALGLHAALDEPAAPPPPKREARRAPRLAEKPKPREPKAPARPKPGIGPMTLVLRCQDAEGSPLAGVMIETRRPSGAPLEPAVSDISGEARIPGLPREEEVSGLARHPACATLAFDRLRPDQGPQILVLDRAATPTGQVLLELRDDQGQALRDFEIAVQRGDGLALIPDVTLQARGEFYSAELSAGEVRLSVRGPRYAESEAVAATVPAGGEIGPLRLIAPRKAALAVTARRPADLPKDAVLELIIEASDKPKRPVSRHPVPVGPGPAEIFLDPGAYRAYLIAADSPGREGPSQDLELAPGQRRQILLTLPEQATAISGVIRDELGRPVAGAAITAGGRSAISDAEGRYALLGLRHGDLQVSAAKAGHLSASSRQTYNGSELLIDLELVRSARLTGRLLSGQGRARVGVPVFLIPTEAAWSLRPYRVESDARGRFSAELRPGIYRLKTGRSADPFDHENGRLIELAPGQILELGDLEGP